MNHFTQPVSAGDNAVLAKSVRSILRNLHASSEHIQASALVSNDGLIIASLLTESVDADRFGAMCASLLALATKAAQEVERGKLRQIILDGTLGPMLLSYAGNVGVLAVAASTSANLGKIILDTRKTAQQIVDLGTTRTFQ